jgi:hypothetical protein
MMMAALVLAAHFAGSGFIVAILIGLIVAAIVYVVASLFLPQPAPILLALLVLILALFWP